MPVQHEVENNNTAVFRVAGVMQHDEFTQIQSNCEALINAVGNINILVYALEFEGWGKAKNWDDWEFEARTDNFINSIGIIGDEKWKDLVYAFTGKGLRPMPIKYFKADEEAVARQWLSEEK